MTQVDLETLVSCETLAHNEPPENNFIPVEDAGVEVPPESFWLSKDSEYDWFDRNAFNYERKESTKGINPSSNSNSTSNSQRFSVNLKSKASIIGLPKTQKNTFVDSKRRNCSKPPNIRLFPKRSESVGKSTTPVAEPGSPKVSCMGRVRSKRCRRRSNSLKRSENPVEISSGVGGEKKKTGFCSKVMSMFRSKKGRKKSSRFGSRKVMEVVMEETVVVEPLRKSVSVRVRDIPVSDEPVAEPPGLGGMKRFVSGRRSGSWTSDDFNQAVSGDLDRRRG